MKIRYVGGPLDRHWFHGPARQPKYRDHLGQPLDFEVGRNTTMAEARRQVAAASYAYDANRAEYVFIGRLLTEAADTRIKALLDQLAEHPDQAEQIETEIQRIERAAR